MYLVGVTLRQLKYLRDAPQVRLCSRHAHSQLIITDILYTHRSLSFAIRTAKAVAIMKRVSTDITNTGIPHRDQIRSMLRRFVYANAELLS